MLFAAIPCVGGSTWQFVNLADGNPATREKIMKHRKIFKKIWRNFEQVADQCISNGGDVAIEWPIDCLYLRFREVKRFLAKYPGMRRVCFDGCAYGLQSQREATKGMHIKKPWTIYTTVPEIHEQLHKLCPGNHEHAHCRGKDAQLSERYVTEIVDIIHQSWRLRCGHGESCQ